MTLILTFVFSPFLGPFIPVRLSSLSLSFISFTTSSITLLPFFWETTNETTRADLLLNPNTIKQEAHGPRFTHLIKILIA